MALKQKGGLGRGLEALIGGETNISDKAGVMEVNINDVEPGPHQPRKRFDEEKMEQLTNSIKQYGIIDPLIVRKDGDKYFIIAGERRWRAARKAGLKTVPIVERDGTDRETMEIALIENIQRADLDPIEEAEAYKRLISEYNLTQEQLSEKVGKNRSTITNSLRLLNFDKEIKDMLADGRLTAGQARPLLSLENKEDRIDLANRIISADLSTRQAEMMAKRISDIRKAEKERLSDGERTEKDDILTEMTTKSEIRHIQNVLKNSLGTKVKLQDNNGKGKIVIEYYSADERERLIEMLSNK